MEPIFKNITLQPLLLTAGAETVIVPPGGLVVGEAFRRFAGGRHPKYPEYKTFGLLKELGVRSESQHAPAQPKEWALDKAAARLAKKQPQYRGKKKRA